MWPLGKLAQRCTQTSVQRGSLTNRSSETTPILRYDNRPTLKIRYRNIEYTALLDTGAANSFIGKNLTQMCRNSKATVVKPTLRGATLANGTNESISEAYKIKFQIGNQVLNEVFHTLESLVPEVVIGMDILRKHRFNIDLQTPQVRLNGQVVTENDFTTLCTVSDNLDIPDLSRAEEVKLQSFLEQELPGFENIRGTTPLVEHEIRLITKDPIKQRYRPQNPKMQAIIDAEVDKMLEDGVIEPSDSPWSSPIVMVKKKDNSYRFCVDFQKINSVTRKDAYPLPYINAILDKLRKAKYISSIDLKQGYWQVPLTLESRAITAFTIPTRGLFHFKVMPFGLHSAPATFQRLMDQIIGPELDPYCFAYLDDIIVLGETFDEHLSHLEEVFRRLKKANLKLNPEKCQFGRKSLKYLGHWVTPEGIRTDPDKVASILELATPTNVRSLRRFLGIASWYRRFVPGFSQIAKPLNDLLKKNSKWQWQEDQQGAFDKLKECLTRAPVLTCPDFQKPFVLQTDASDNGLGAALIQHLHDGDHVIAYASRSLTSSEKKYTVTEKECLAIVWGIEKMRPYLEGYRFVVITDHQSLRWLHSLKNPSGRLARWSIYLQQYDFEIRYRKGVLNKIADALSRNPTDPPPSEEELLTISETDICPWYEKKRSEVQSHPDLFPDFCVRDGKLFRHFLDMTDAKEAEMQDPWKLCVPKSARPRVLQENHDQPTAGHLGIAKTTSRIAARYYWPGMFRDIAQYVRRCRSCQEYKTSQQQTPGRMQPTTIRGPWETVSSDLVGPLPRSTKGNCYVLVFQDRFTKWIVCKAIRTATAKAVSQALYDEILMRFGRPATVITDNGTQYTGQPFRQLLKEFGINHRFTPPYTPQANPVERANKTIKTMIAQFCEGDHKKWDTHLSELIFAFNTSRNDSTGFTPAFLNYGRELEAPKTHLRDEQQFIPSEDPEPTTADVKHNENRLNRLQETFELVRIHLSRAFASQSRYYNLRRREWQCKPGDRVMKKEHPLSSAVKGFAAKLAPKYSGPYTITRKLSPVVYDLVDRNNRKLQRIHIKDLKPAY